MSQSNENSLLYFEVCPGNYPKEIWRDIVKCIITRDVVEFDRLTDKLGEVSSPPFFLLADIHHFSELCIKEDASRTVDFLKSFFRLMVEKIDQQGGMTVKTIGDALLVVISCDQSSKAEKLAKDLIKLYQNNYKMTFNYTDLVTLVTHPVKVIKGFVGASSYKDYSYWAPWLNNLFKVVKDKTTTEGHAYYVEIDGSVRPIS